MRIKINLPGIPTPRYRWYVGSDQSSLFLRAGLSGKEERLIKSANMSFQRDRKTRTVFFVPLPAPNEQTGTRLFVKRYKIYNFLERVKSFFTPSKAEYEFEMYRYLKSKNIPTAQPVAFLEIRKWNILLESYLILTELPKVLTLKEFIPAGKFGSPAEPLAEKKNLLRKLAELTRRLHNEHFYHQDVHTGNILVQNVAPEPLRLYFTDLHNGRRCTMTARRKTYNLARLCSSLRLIFPLTDIVRFLTYYRSLDLRKETIKPFVKEVLTTAERIKFRHWQSRARRCLRKSSQFAIERANSFKIYHRRTIPIGRIKELIQQHKNLVKQTPEKLFKVTEKRIISLLSSADPSERSVRADAGRYYIKEYRYSLFNIIASLFRGHAVYRSGAGHAGKSDWLAHHGLTVRGIATPEMVTLVEEKIGPFVTRAYLVTKEIKDASPSGQYGLNNLGTRATRRHKNIYLKEFARAITHLHQRGIFHADLKANNILIKQEEEPEKWKFYFLDLDRVKFKSELNWKERIKNLAQLNAATPAIITRADRLRFFRHYSSGFPPLTPPQYREIIKEIMNQTIERHHFWPPLQGTKEQTA